MLFSEDLLQMEQLPKLSEFYRGQTLLVTGFSGFLGQLIVEKLLWSIPEINRVYVLIRSKKSLGHKERLEKIKNSRLFTRLREHTKDQLQKIIAVDGDLNQPGLGLSSEQRSELCQNVTIVIHSAASVSFDDPLPITLDTNVKGAKAALELALDMHKLISYVHVSTAYSNSNRSEVEEKIYPPLADWKVSLEIRDKIDEATFQILKDKYINHMANTYVFAKSLAEQVVQEYSDRLPIVILRPSIVTAVMHEPVTGWVENLNGPNAFIIGSGSGLIRTSYLKKDVRPDFIPADFVVRGIIVTACAKAVDSDKRLQVYNCSSKELSPTSEEYADVGLKAVYHKPFNIMLWKPNVLRTSSPFLFFINLILFQLIPAFLLDILLRLAGKAPMLWKIQKKIYLTTAALNYFMMNKFFFHNAKLYDLDKKLHPDDLDKFHAIRRPEGARFFQYFTDSVRYQGTWFFKMTDEDHKKAVKLRDRVHMLDRVVKSCFYIYVAWKVYALIHIIPICLNSTYRFVMNF